MAIVVNSWGVIGINISVLGGIIAIAVDWAGFRLIAKLL